MSKNLSLHLSNENALRYISASDGKALIGSTPKNHIANSFKSPLKPSFVLNKSPYGSPTNFHHKGSFAVNHLKSPSDKVQQVLASMENDGQENYYYENKCIPTTSTKRDSKTSGSTPQTAVKPQKSNSISQKAGSALSKASKSNKVSFYKYEPSIKKTVERSHEPTVSSQVHMNSTLTLKEGTKQLNLTTKKELSLSKKASLPTNLKLTLDKIYTKDGSSSHRIHLNSPKSESSNNVNNAGGNSSVHRKNGKSVALDNKSKNDQSLVKEPNAKNKLNTLLVGLSRPSPSQADAGKVPKLNVRDINSMNTTPKKFDVELEEEQEEEIEHEEDDVMNTSKRYQKLMQLLKEKNNEIRRLSKDKNELQNTLDVVGEELTTLQKMKSWFKDKGKSAANLQLDLNEIVLDTEDQNNQLTKKGRLSQDFSRNLMQSRYTSQRSMCNLSIGDTKEARTPTSVLNTSHSNMDGASDRLRMALSGDFAKKQKSKKHADKVQTSTDFLQIPVERSYLSMSPYESNRIVAGGNSNSHLAEYGLKERTNSLVHNETAVKSSIKAKLEGKEVHYSKERAKSMQQNTTPKNGLVSTCNSRKQSAYGITQKTQLENAKKCGNNTSNNDITVDVGILKRKQSYDVNYNLEKTQSLLKRKQSEVRNMSAVMMENGRKGEEKLDIGKALGDLKNRIANLLSKRSEDGDRKLQLVCQTIQRTLLNGGDFQ